MNESAKKLFHLGNDVVKLQKLIDECFPKTNSSREILLEMLRIIDIIRIESYVHMPSLMQKEERKDYDFRIEDCSESLMHELANYMESVGVDFKVLDIKTGHFVET